MDHSVIQNMIGSLGLLFFFWQGNIKWKYTPSSEDNLRTSSSKEDELFQRGFPGLERFGEAVRGEGNRVPGFRDLAFFLPGFRELKLFSSRIRD